MKTKWFVACLLLVFVGTVLCFTRMSYANVIHVPGGDVCNYEVGMGAGPWTTGNTYIIDGGDITVPHDRTLTIDDGVTVEFADGAKLYVNGQLIAQSHTIPITFTRLENSTEYWGGLVFNSSCTPGNVLDGCNIEYSSGNGAITLYYTGTNVNFLNCNVINNLSNGMYIDHSSPNISHCSIRNCTGEGIYWCGEPALGSITNCEIDDTQSYPLEIPFSMVTRFSNLGCSSATHTKDTILINGGSVDETGIWPKHQLPYHVTGNISLSNLGVLTIEPGVWVGFSDGIGFTVNGSLNAQGTETQRIIFTRASQAINNWNSLTVNGSNSGPSIFRYFDISYAGNPSYGGNILFANCDANDVLIDHCTSCFSSSDGIRSNSSNNSKLSITNCTASQNTGYGFNGGGFDTISNCIFTANKYPMALAARQLFRLKNLTVTGNTFDTIWVDAFTINASTIAETGTWRNFGAPYWLHQGDVTIDVGAAATIEPGVRICNDERHKITCFGSLFAQGSDAQHIVFDRAAGYSGNWSSLLISGQASTTVLSYCDILNAGVTDAPHSSVYFYYSDNASMDHCTVSNSLVDGILSDYSKPAITHTTIMNCAHSGVWVVHNRPERGLPNFGTADAPGYNVFRNNGINGRWNLYNNSYEDIFAIGNDWGLNDSALIDATIFDKTDEYGAAGEVYFMPYLGPLWSDEYTATAYSNGTKMALDPSANMHVAFQRLGKVCYSASTNGGTSWQSAVELDDPGYAATPCIALAPRDASPCISYNSTDGPFQIVRFARKDGENWSNNTLPGIGEVYGSAFFRSPTSMVIKSGNGSAPDTATVLVEETYGNPTAGTTWNLRMLRFTVNPLAVLKDTTLQTAHFGGQPWPEHSPSVAVDINKQCHVCYSLQGSVYNVAQNTDGSWAAPERLSELGTESSEGYIEAFQDSLAVVWTVQDANGGDIYRIAKGIGNSWRDIQPVSNTPSQASQHPVSANGVTFWSENVGGTNFETYYQKKNGSFVDLSNTATTASIYPAVASGSSSLYYCAWNETNGDPNNPLRPCISNIAVAGLGSEGKKAYYTVSVGGAQASSYTIHRDGYYIYPSQIAVDYANDELVYNLPYLNPSNAYILQVVGYHESSGKWNEQVKIDDRQAKVLKITAHVPETLSVDIPQSYYANDHQVELKIRRLTGDYSAVCNVTLYQKEAGSKDGTPVAENSEVPMPKYEFRLLPCHPNPVKDNTYISFNLSQSGPTKLEIYNIQGQLVKKLVQGSMSAGSYTAAWDCKDDFGRTVASGMYFYRLTAVNTTATQKLILLK